MKNTFLILIIFTSFLLFLFTSCSPNAIASSGTWKGEMDNFFESFDDVEIDTANFGSIATPGNKPSDADIYIIINDNAGNEESVEFEGTYYVNSDYSFKAVLYSDDKYPNGNMFFATQGGNKIYVRKIRYHLIMKGYVNGYTSEGYGDYDMNCTIYFEDNTVMNDVKFDGDWKLSK